MTECVLTSIFSDGLAQNRVEVLRHLLCPEETVGFEARIVEVGSFAAVLAVECGEGVGVGSFDSRDQAAKDFAARRVWDGMKDRPVCDRWPAL